MAKFYGKIGFAESTEIKPGVWKEKITEYEYFGDTLRSSSNTQSSDQLNDNINIANEISILGDPFAYENFYSMKYVKLMGAKWKITKVEVKYPRLILTVGGVYNG